jgi:hypothetical protein
VIGPRDGQRQQGKDAGGNQEFVRVRPVG